MVLEILVNKTLEIRRDNYYRKVSKTVAIRLSMTDLANRKEKLAFSEYKKLVGLIRQQSNLFLELGFTLKRIRDEKLFKLVGDGGFENWGQFLAQPEIGIKPSTAFFYIQIYEQFIERLKLDQKVLSEAPFYKLQKLLPVIRKEDPDRAIEIIDELMPLGASDFNAEIQKHKGVTDFDKPPEVKRCEVCGHWEILTKDICQCKKKNTQ